tara:strand:- start:54 stop:1028 length:975 start_codon:yes stop_codon:yes gene_type:complete
MATVEENKGVVYPSNLRCALQVNVPTPEVEDPEYSLSNYMRLPVDQYVGIELPMGAEMKRVPGDRTMFQLEIPGLKFLSLEVKPVVRVRVRLIGDGSEVMTWTGQSGHPGGKTPEWRAAEAARLEEIAKEAECVDDDDEPEECPAPAPAPTPTGRAEREDVELHGPCVLIEAISCRVEGKTVEELGVNDLFVFRGTTCFRWRSRGDGTDVLPVPNRTGPGGEDEAGTGWAKAPVVGAKKLKDGESCIVGWADIGVGVDPPGAFALLPQSFAEKVGDAVMRTTLKALQSVFLKGLAKDYAKWASDADYRAQREIAAAAAAEEAGL